MTAKSNVKTTLGDKNDIVVEERENETVTIDNSERLSIIENNIHHVLNLDDQSIEERTLTATAAATEGKNETRSYVVQKFPCESAHNILPDHPSTWPQRPIMIRPTPQSSTKVIGVVSHKILSRDLYSTESLLSLTLSFSSDISAPGSTIRL